MRSIGYSFNNAIADIIDNSITAEADRIEIEMSHGEIDACRKKKTRKN